MSKMGRPPKLYTVTTTNLGTGKVVAEEPFVGLQSLAAYLGVRETLVGTMLSTLGGEFMRKREMEDGTVLVDHVQRVD